MDGKEDSTGLTCIQEICMKCSCNTDSKVIDSRTRPSGATRRRRECSICGARWSTLEVEIDISGTRGRLSDWALLKSSARASA